jgi:4'-phosphopantetheinyl transferase
LTAEVTVHVTAVAEARAAGRLGRYVESLEDGERARLVGMRVESARHQFVIGRALIRHALSRRAAALPHGWRLVAGAHGRPEVDGPAGGPRLRFSLSHTAEVVACAVTVGDDVGLDVERVDADRADLAVARQLFAPAEFQALAALPAAARAARFFDYWTLKEAYVKACGRGLSVPLDAFWFALPPAPGAAIRIAFAQALADDPARWRFDQRRLAGDHVLAVAVAGPPGRGPLSLSVEPCLP